MPDAVPAGSAALPPDLVGHHGARAAAGHRSALLRAAVDRLANWEPEAAQAARAAVDGLLREELVLDGARAWREGDTWLLLAPCPTQKDAESLARSWIHAVRRLRAPDEVPRRVTLSVGVAHDGHRASPDLSTLLHVADEGLRVAQTAGGDRAVHTELYAHFQRSAPAAARGALAPIAKAHPAAPQAATPKTQAPEAAPAATLERDLAESLRRALAAAHGQPGHLAKVEQRLLELLNPAPGAAEGAKPAADEGPERIGILERRIAKLVQALEIAEQEILRLRQEPDSPDSDSPFRAPAVRAAGAEFSSLKNSLMQQIYEANLALHEQVRRAV